ncbi:MAG: alpha-amylase family glycosyl hydrolase [Eubacterium sp.]
MDYRNYQIYHIFTLGFCGAEELQDQCDGLRHRLSKITELIPYLKGMGINALLLGPLFSAVSHGYDTIDYRTVDSRLGTNDDLKNLVNTLHAAGIAVIFDCVFNHVGREFFAFGDLKENREASRYVDWFSGVNFWEDNRYGDGFRYDDWAGCDNLVKLNLHNPEVRGYLKETAAFWMETFGIDGLRMDAANVMDLGFLRELSDFIRGRDAHFFFLGECVHADYYGRLIGDGGMDAVTNYEDYKGMYSSLKDHNYFEIAYSLNRLFARGGLLEGVTTANFVDNHDVDRVASTLDDERLLPLLYLMLYTIPGIPNVYYGSEQGAKARKGQGTDAPLRPCAESMHFDPQSGLYQYIARLGHIRGALPAITQGDYAQLFVTNGQFGFKRHRGDQSVLVLFNIEKTPVLIHNENLHGIVVDLLNYELREYDLDGAITIPACGGMILLSREDVPAELYKEEEEIEEPLYIYNEEVETRRTHRDYIEMALTEARLAADEGEVPVGAVVVLDGRVIGRGHNRKEVTKDPTAHAEILAIRQAAETLGSWRLKDCTLYVTAEPCPMCMGAVIQARISTLVYGTWEERYGSVETTAQLGTQPMLPKDMTIIQGIGEIECQSLLQEFFGKRR